MRSTTHRVLKEHNICVQMHHVPKCISFHKAIVVITESTYCFHDNIIYIYIYIYVVYILYIYINIYIYIYIYIIYIYDNNFCLM